MKTEHFLPGQDILQQAGRNRITYERSIYLASVDRWWILKEYSTELFLIEAKLCIHCGLDGLIDVLSFRGNASIAATTHEILEDVIATDIMALFKQYFENRDSFVQVIFMFNRPNLFHNKVQSFFVFFANHKHALNTLKISNTSNTQSYIVNDIKRLHLDSYFLLGVSQNRSLSRAGLLLSGQLPAIYQNFKSSLRAVF